MCDCLSVQREDLQLFFSCFFQEAAGSSATATVCRRQHTVFVFSKPCDNISLVLLLLGFCLLCVCWRVAAAAAGLSSSGKITAHAVNACTVLYYYQPPGLASCSIQPKTGCARRSVLHAGLVFAITHTHTNHKRVSEVVWLPTQRCVRSCCC